MFRELKTEKGRCGRGYSGARIRTWMWRLWAGQFSPASTVHLRATVRVNWCKRQVWKLIMTICDPRQMLTWCCWLNMATLAGCWTQVSVFFVSVPSGTHSQPRRMTTTKMLWNRRCACTACVYCFTNVKHVCVKYPWALFCNSFETDLKSILIQNN